MATTTKKNKMNDKITKNSKMFGNLSMFWIIHEAKKKSQWKLFFLSSLIFNSFICTKMVHI